MRQRNRYRAQGIAVVVLAAAVLSIGARFQVRDAPSYQPLPTPQYVEFGSTVWIPQDFEELVANPEVEAIVVGVVGEVHSEATEVIEKIVETPQPTQLDEEYNRSDSMKLTYFTFTPSQVLLNGSESIEPDVPIWLGTAGWMSEFGSEAEAANEGMPMDGREYLVLFFRPSHVDGTFSTPARHSMFLLDNVSGVITYANGTPVPYAEGMDREEFMAEVEAAIE